ncbi:hypothetical protein PRZ48_011984 [Zasmidium cellare]|uniref:Uncharacterized protein n=1 Tax=Zasmidium cellare TaxID=395010 RepID=A0ABR0E8V8_ZASCE|nr:hypothetical protein PRZ48_011984 [Zasmidium cellare]
MSSSNFTEAELKVLLRGWLCLESGIPKMNYDKLAQVCDFKSKASASTRWSEARKKLTATFGEDGNGNGDAATSPVKKTPKKRGAAKETDGTPKKRGRKSKAEKDAIAAAAAEEDDDEEIGSPKKKVKKEVKAEAEDEDDGVGKLLSGAKEYSKGLIEAGSDDEV